MTGFGVWLVEAINRLTPPPPSLRELHRAKLSVEAYQNWEYEEAHRLCPEFGHYWDIRNKNLLDIGSGLGGKLKYYAELGANSITAIDLRSSSTKAAHKHAKDGVKEQTKLVTGDAALMPFYSNCFDVIVSINVFEHVDDLESTLTESKRVLCPGGLIFLHFPPFYSPWGAHLEGWINFPWPHVFFSDEILLEAVQRIEVHNQKNADYIPSAQVDWAKAKRLPELNRITAHGFIRLVRKAGLVTLESQMLPIGRHYLAHRGLPARIALWQLQHLASLPVLREVLTTKMMFVLTKE